MLKQRMKSISAAGVIYLTITLASCSQNNTPTSPILSNGISGKSFSLVGYGISLDSTYYKVWSDSSWEEYYADTSIGGKKYVVLLENSGYEYYYGPDGYAGFFPSGGSLIMFDSALASIPDTMVGGQTYTLQTTFTYQGVSYVLTDLEALVDTATVGVSFGNFPDCRVLQSSGEINGVIQYSSTRWFARGPADIVRQDYTGYQVEMSYGVVNDQPWGVKLSGTAPGVPAVESSPANTKQKFFSPASLHDQTIQALAPMILRGIIARGRLRE